MSRSTAYLLLLAICAIGAALWYRQQVYSAKPVPSTVEIAFVTGGSGPYWQLTTQGAKAAAEKYGCTLVVKMPEDEEALEEQMTILTGLNVEEIDGLALSPLDAEGQTQLINRFQQKIPVATYDADAPLSTRRIHIGTSNYGAGRQCARLVSEAIPDGGQVIVLLANLTKENMIDRKSGFEDEIGALHTESESEASAPEITVVEYLTDEGSPEKIESNIVETLEKYPDLACIVGMNAKHGPVIQRVLKEANKIGKVKVVAFDEEKETLNGIQVGHVYATIAQDPYKYGYEAVRMLSMLCRDSDSEIPIVGGGTMNITTEAIRQDNLDKFRSRLDSRAAEESK